jgi:hypothetical protein
VSPCAGALHLDHVLFESAREFWPTFSDYNGDGVDDLLVRRALGGSSGVQARIISGADASVLREYDAPSSSIPIGGFNRAGTLPDSDGDGKREILLGDPYNAWAVKSTAGGGQWDLLPQVFSFTSLPYGQGFGIGDRTTLITSGDESKLLFVDSLTGEVHARVSHNVPYGGRIGSLGQSAINLGDITGDGIDDFASSGGNVRHFPAATGSLFLFNGVVSTAGTEYVAVPNLSAGSLLAELSGVEFMGSGSAGGWENTTVNLGDPNPANGVAEFLIVTGSPWADYQAGGLAAHLLTRQANGTFTTQLVASYTASAQWHYGAELVNVGDVNGDHVADFALLVENYNVGAGRLGRIQVINGAGLLDGFDPAADVIQAIDGLPQAFFYGSMHRLGDYDHDGRNELAASVLYNGEGGVYGYAQHVYEIVPEPSSSAGIAMLAAAMLMRRSRARTTRSPRDEPRAS